MYVQVCRFVPFYAVRNTVLDDWPLFSRPLQARRRNIGGGSAPVRENMTLSVSHVLSPIHHSLVDFVKHIPLDMSTRHQLACALITAAHMLSKVGLSLIIDSNKCISTSPSTTLTDSLRGGPTC